MKISRLISGITIVSSLMAVSCDNAKKDGQVATTETDTVVATPPVSPDGKTKITITKEEVPAKTYDAFTRKVPAAANVQYSKVEKINDAGTDTVVYYHFDYDRDNYSYWVVYDEEGMIVEDNSYTKISGLPDAVSKSIAEYFPGYTVTEIDKDNDKDIIQYEVQMERGDQKRKVKFLVDGGMFKIK